MTRAKKPKESTHVFFVWKITGLKNRHLIIVDNVPEIGLIQWPNPSIDAAKAYHDDLIEKGYEKRQEFDGTLQLKLPDAQWTTPMFW